MWYGEGDEMVFIDGDERPTLNGTGTEDYFNTSWSPKELFAHPAFGYARVNNGTGWLGRTHVYRFHLTDPVHFEKSCRFTIEHGHNNNLTLDLASVAYWYQDTAAPLPRSFTAAASPCPRSRRPTSTSGGMPGARSTVPIQNCGATSATNPRKRNSRPGRLRRKQRSPAGQPCAGCENERRARSVSWGWRKDAITGSDPGDLC